MRRRLLGRTGVLVSEFALGAMTFGKEADEAAAHTILDTYLEAGGNLVDTADVYQQGGSEEILGRWLAVAPGCATTCSSRPSAGSRWVRTPTRRGCPGAG